MNSSLLLLLQAIAMLLLLPVTQAFFAPNVLTIPRSTIKRTTHRYYSNARDEAEALLARAREMRQQVADLQGISLQQVEQEAHERKVQQLQAEQAIRDRRKEEMTQRNSNNNNRTTVDNDGSFLQVPETFDDQVYQAKQAVERAFASGITRQVVRFALLEPDQMLLQQDGQWPGGAQQMYRRAAGPLTRQLLSQLKPLKRVIDDDDDNQQFARQEGAWTRKKPQVTSKDVWDFDGSALISAEWKSTEDDKDKQSLSAGSVIVQALVQPNTDDKYTRDIESLDQSVGSNQLLMLVNPFWRNVDSWGINMLAPNAKKNAQRVIFDGGFTETYCLIKKSARGEDCVALKCYPYDWQLYAYADGEYWPFEPYLVHLGSTTEEPTGSDFGLLLNEREEFKMSKNMRQMNRMRK